jgi:predicted RNase H-like nuclease (RuvC/YqgF family)
VNDRELRLRQRIDQLTDRIEQLEATIEQLEVALADCRTHKRSKTRKIYEVTQSRDTWHHRWKTK